MCFKNRFKKILTLNILFIFMLSFFMPAVIAQTPEQDYKEPVQTEPPQNIQTPLPNYNPPPQEDYKSEDFIRPEIIEPKLKNFIRPQEDYRPEDFIRPEMTNPSPNLSESREPIYNEETNIQHRFIPQEPNNQEFPKTSPGLPAKPEQNLEKIMTPECQKKEINDPYECAKFMQSIKERAYPITDLAKPKIDKNFIPPPNEAFKMMFPKECQEAKITTREECDKVMRSKFEKKFEEKGKFEYGNNFGPADMTMDMPKDDMIMMMRPPIGGLDFRPDMNQMKEQEINMRIEMEMRSGKVGECKNKDVNECRKILKEKISEDFADKGYIPPECKNANINDPAQCENLMMVANLPPPCRDANISDPSDCKLLLFKQNMPPICRDQGIVDPAECEKSMITKHMPPECQKAGVTSPEECEKIMMEKHLPPDCKEKGITNMNECEQYMSKSYAPKICADKNALSPTECFNVIFDAHGKPKECEGLPEFQCMKMVMAGQAGKEIMKKVDKDLPPKCIELGAKTIMECQDLSMKKNVPAECKEAGAFTPEACDKVMFEKYKPTEEEIKQFMPKPCIDANATTKEECAAIMDNMYMPKECKDANITTRKECDILMQKLYTPPECQAVGAYDKESCEQVMRAKFMAPECKEAGITDPNACEAMMMEKYAKEIKCRGVDDELCQIAIGKRHLGQIVKKNKQVEEIKDKIDPFVGKNFKMRKKAEKITEQDKEIVNNQTQQTQEISPTQTAEEQERIKEQEEKTKDLEDLMPIQPEQDANLLIILATEESIILEDETIVQTIPAAIMFDNDEDGVPNDIEKRLGTDPNNSDTDNDGYLDGEEINDNYNPLGAGDIWQSGIPEKMSGFDQALFNNRPLDQPIISGEEAPEELIIETAAEVTIIKEENPSESQTSNKPETESTGLFNVKKVHAKEIQKTQIKLAGLATPNTVIAIFIYSKLAIVATAKTNESGHWEYVVDQPLSDGEHTVYIATVSNAGKIVKKSSGFPLFIKEAQAVTAQDFISSSLSIKTRFNYFQLIIITAVIIAILALAYLLYRRKQGKDINFINHA